MFLFAEISRSLKFFVYYEIINQLLTDVELYILKGIQRGHYALIY